MALKLTQLRDIVEKVASAPRLNDASKFWLMKSAIRWKLKYAPSIWQIMSAVATT